MEDSLLSQKQFQYLLAKIDVLNEEVNTLKVKLVPEAVFDLYSGAGQSWPADIPLGVAGGGLQ